MKHLPPVIAPLLMAILFTALNTPLDARPQRVEVAALSANEAPQVRRNLSPVEQAATAEQAYKERRYQDVVRIYEELADQAPYDPRVLYNLGTAYAQAGERGLAIWRYLQALELKPRNPDIWNNLEVLGYERNSMLPFPLDHLYQRFSGNEWAMVAGSATCISLLLFALGHLLLRGTAGRGWARQAALWCGVIALLAWPFTAGHFHQEELARHAVVVAENTVMRTGPSESQISTYSLNPGSVVRIRERRQDGWLKISFGTGYVGWVEQDALRYL